MEREEILDLLSKAEKQGLPAYQIVAGIRAILDPGIDVESLADLVHNVLCRRQHARDHCRWYLEEPRGEQWSLVCHKRFLDIARYLLTVTHEQDLIAKMIIIMAKTIDDEVKLAIAETVLKIIKGELHESPYYAPDCSLIADDSCDMSDYNT